MTNITLRVTLDAPQRQAIMAQVRSQYPETATTTQAINAGGFFRIQAVRGATLPATLTEQAVRQIALDVLKAQEGAERLGTFRTARQYDRSGQRTLKPYHKSRYQ